MLNITTKSYKCATQPCLFCVAEMAMFRTAVHIFAAVHQFITAARGHMWLSLLFYVAIGCSKSHKRLPDDITQ